MQRLYFWRRNRIKTKSDVSACEDFEEGSGLTRSLDFLLLRMLHENEEQFPEWEHAEKGLMEHNNTRDDWGQCVWCNTISHHKLIDYDDNGEPVCPECKRRGPW